MDENSALIEAILREEDEQFGANTNQNNDHGWKTVSYKKHGRKSRPSPDNSSDHVAAADVFKSIEQYSGERRRRMLGAQNGADTTEVADEVGSDDAVANDGVVENGGAAVTKSKPKKVKKPKVTVSEAAAKINDTDLAVFLADITSSYESRQDIQLMRFADYFGRAFASVNASQFPWMKTLKESSVAKMVDIPLSHIPEDVYKTSMEWLNQQSVEAVASFVLWALDSIIADPVVHQGASKGSKQLVQQAPSKSQVAIFVVLAMVLRRKPDVLISLSPIMKDDPKYRSEEKLPLLLWATTQASQGDLVIGLFIWVRFLLPMTSGRSNCNPQSRDLVLQLAERIVSSPKARTILVNSAVRKGERLVPPSALELLMRVTFPAPSARVKATERFEAIYPLLKEVALAVSPGSRAMKQVTQEISQFAPKASGEGNPVLASEASDLFIWCLTQNPDCYKQWEDIYLDNLEASVIILSKLVSVGKVQLVKDHSGDPLKVAVNSFRVKNEKALASGDADAARLATFKEAEKHCKILSATLSKSNGCWKTTGYLAVGIAITAAAFISQDTMLWNLKKLVDSGLSQTFASYSI